jgi:CRP/FNR family cyclic AMP-dependent transcriptional regulator
LVDAEVIASLPMFREGLQADEVELLAPHFNEESVPAGAVLFPQDSRADKLYVVLSGRLEIRFKPYDGEILTVAELKEGGVLGWSSVLGRRNYTSSAVAIEDSRVLSIRGQALRRLCETHPKTGVVILERLAEVIAERLRSTHEHVVRMLQEGMHARVGLE